MKVYVTTDQQAARIRDCGFTDEAWTIGTDDAGQAVVIQGVSVAASPHAPLWDGIIAPAVVGLEMAREALEPFKIDEEGSPWSWWIVPETLANERRR